MTDDKVIDFSAKLLAFVGKYGLEVFALSKPHHKLVMASADLFNIKGGEYPDLSGVNLINKYMGDLEVDWPEVKNKVEWVNELCQHLQIDKFK